MTVAFWMGLSLTIGGATLAYCWQMRRVFREEGDRFLGMGGAIALGLIFLIAASPALASPHLKPTLAALGASEDTADQAQQAFEEQLKLDPTGGHYKGIEYASKSVQSQPTDQALLDEIQPQLSDDVVVAISNGSVRLSGRVKDRATAEGIVEQVKSTAGVHEVAFDLGLENTDQKTIR